MRDLLKSIVITSIFSCAISLAMECRHRVALIADPWSSARFLVEELERRHVDVHGIQSQKIIPDWGQKTFFLAPGRSLIKYDNDFESLLRQVIALNPDEILYGADGDGLLLVDRLTERMGRRGNGTRFSLERRTKTGTQKVLGDAGLANLDGILTRDLDEARAFVARVGGYPIFIKPNDDGGGHLAFQLNDDHDLQEKLALILSSSNETTMLPFEEAAVQEFADGPEFAVQGTVRDGVIKFSSVIRYYKASVDKNTSTYLSEWILRPDSRQVKALLDFVRLANDKVELRNGPFHWEVKISRRKGAVVAIELNPRLIGGSMVEWLKDCVGYSDIELTAEAYFFADEFAARPDIYSLQRPGFVFEVLAPEEGVELDESVLREIEKLPGYRRVRRLKPEVGPLPKTDDMDSISATFDFAHDSIAELNQSYRTLDKMRKSGKFFRLGRLQPR